MSHFEKNQQLLRERAAVSVSNEYRKENQLSYLIVDAMIYASELHMLDNITYDYKNRSMLPTLFDKK